jgi:maltose O-acetyltransferase
MRKIIQTISSIFFVRYFVKLILNIKSFFDRIWSNLKFKSLVKNSGDSTCHYSTEIKFGENIRIGNNTRIGPNCTLGAKGSIIIGDNIVVSKYVSIETAGLDYKKGPPYSSHKSSQIIIENGVWIGSNVIVLGGVTIGENSIIGAGCVITRNIPPKSLIVGMPNRVLK